MMPYMLRMSSIGVLAVVGREGSGRYNWIKYVADMLELMYPGRSKVYISDGIGKKLASMKEKRNVVRYSMIAEDIVSYLKEIEEELQSRYELLAKGSKAIRQKQITCFLLSIILMRSSRSAIVKRRLHRIKILSDATGT